MNSEHGNPPEFYQPLILPQSVPTLLPADQVDWRNGILVRGVNWLGDTVMTLPALQQLRQLLPDQCPIYVMCPRGLAPVYEAVECITAVLPLSGKRAGSCERSELRRIKPGVALVLPNSFGSALDVFGKGIPVRVGRKGRGRSWLLTDCLPECKREGKVADHHQLSDYLELIAVFGEVNFTYSMPRMHIENSESTAKRYNIEKRGPGLLVMAPGAAYGPAKQWPPASFHAVLKQWIGNGGSAVLVGSRSERQTAGMIARDIPHTVNVAGETTLKELMDILNYADFAVANDSGAMHLAAAVGTPGVAVFGSTDPIATGPLGAPFITLCEQAECAPCFQRSCPRAVDRGICLSQIEPERVMAALLRLAHV